MNQKLIRLALGTMSAVAITCGYTAPASAASYYIDQGSSQASDSNPGTESLPWKTLYRAEQQALQPGDTVFVKPGTYDASVGGTWTEPAINPPASGTADHPITFRAIPRHGATLRGNGSAPAIGSYRRNYVVIDGFVVTSTTPKGIGVYGVDGSRVKGVVIQNNIIRGIHNSHATDNTDGIRIDYASGTQIRNNKISDIHNGTNTYNAAGIKLYWTDNTLVENNEISDAAAGIFDKKAGVNNVYRRNYIHNCNVLGIQIYTNEDGPNKGSRVYENVIDKCGKSVTIHRNGTSSVVDDTRVYNNVFANYGSEGGMYPSEGNGVAYIYNNIFYRTTVPSVGDFYTYNDPASTVAMMDYNLYVSAPKFMLGRYQTNRRFTSLAAWQTATGFDRHSLAGDPGFVNAASGDFRLKSGSIANGSGRTGGASGGTPVNIGAYPQGNEVVGLLHDTTSPVAPVLISVQ